VELPEPPEEAAPVELADATRPEPPPDDVALDGVQDEEDAPAPSGGFAAEGAREASAVEAHPVSTDSSSL